MTIKPHYSTTFYVFTIFGFKRTLFPESNIFKREMEKYNHNDLWNPYLVNQLNVDIL